MNDAPVRDSDAAPQLTALNGMRFFAVFHIFLYHLWSIRFESPRQQGAWANAYSNMDSFPAWFSNLIAHGYLSTSFFFLLSGFILAYLYWAPGGELATTRRYFWWQRFTRIYPAHLIALGVTILLTLPRYFFDPSAPSIPLAAASAVATATLTQAWVPPLVPIWSWPTWALSAVVFLYLVMPWLMRQLSKLSRRQQIGLLVASPLISLIPTFIFLQFFPDGGKDRQNWQIFLGSTPLFWVAHFAAGMLMSRIFGISRFETAWREKPKPWVSLGDLALGRGLVARVFSLPGMNFLGQLSFSIFIWQNLFMGLGFAMAGAAPQSTSLSFWFAVIGLLLMSILSTRFIEKPLARRLRKRNLTTA